MAAALPANETWFTFSSVAGNFSVYAFTGREEVNEPYEYAVDLVSRSDSEDMTALLGTPACLHIQDRSGETRHAHGLIRRMRQLHTANEFTHYLCSIVPRLWYLGKIRDHRIFQNISVVEIIEKLLKEQGFTDKEAEFQLFYKYEPREYCVQYGETTLHFLSRLCEEEGIYFFHAHSESGHTLCFCDREGGAKISGESGIRFYPGSGSVPDSCVIQELTFNEQVNSNASTYREWNFQKPKLDLDVSRHEDAPVPPGMRLEQYAYPHLYQLQAEGTRYAKLQLQRQLTFSAWITGHSDAARFLPGFTFSVHEHPRENVNAAWWVLSVSQEGFQPQVLEHEDPDRGFSYQATFTAIPERTRYIPLLRHPKNRVYGQQTAIVTGPEGEEIYPDKYGRVKAQFFWDRADQWNEKTTCWIRVSQGWAGSLYGAMAIPRIGHEVIVSFLEGNPDRPIITGRVYHELNKPPYPLPEHKTRSVFKSMSTPGKENEPRGFNEFRIEDKRGVLRRSLWN
jgi:type VI secretion system secreted protein VgrG